MDRTVDSRYLERLGRVGRVINFDKRGTGLSDRVPVDSLPTLEQRIDDITAVLDATGSSSAVVFGLNHGAPLALLFAATRPERTRSLIVSGGFARFLEADDYPWGFPKALVPRVVAQMEDHWDEPHAFKQVAPSYVDDARARDWWATMQRMSVSPAAAVALWKMSVETDARDVLPGVHVPTLITHLADDRLVDPRCSQHLAEHIAGARLVEIPGRDLIFGDNAAWVDAFEEFITGRVPQIETDRMLAAVMFTDIVDSTRHLSELGDRAWRDVLDRHDVMVDRALDRYRGRKVNATGDGVLATFDGPARAVQCACAIREGVTALGIEVRAGVHIGEIELRGDDVSGLAVHLCARVSGLARASEVPRHENRDRPRRRFRAALRRLRRARAEGHRRQLASVRRRRIVTPVPNGH
jgi:class 3 adenylate cyclase